VGTLEWLPRKGRLFVGWFGRFLLVPASSDPLTYQQDVHDDGEDEDEDAPDSQYVIPSVHSLIPVSFQGYSRQHALASGVDLV
jgi:hypothetical protein